MNNHQVTLPNRAVAIAKRIEGIDDSEIAAVSFIFWIAYSMECLALKTMLATSARVRGKQHAHDEQVTTMLFSRASFGTKIIIMKKVFLPSGTPVGNKVLGFLETTKKLRDYVSHGDFSRLTYKGKHLGNLEAQQTMVDDFEKILS